MGLLGQRIGDERLEDFVHVTKVAKDLGLIAPTIKRWLKNKVVDGVVWGRDRRNWVVIHRDSVVLLKKYRDSIKVQ